MLTKYKNYKVTNGYNYVSTKTHNYILNKIDYFVNHTAILIPPTENVYEYIPHMFWNGIDIQLLESKLRDAGIAACGDRIFRISYKQLIDDLYWSGNIPSGVLGYRSISLFKHPLKRRYQVETEIFDKLVKQDGWFLDKGFIDWQINTILKRDYSTIASLNYSSICVINQIHKQKIII